MPVMCQALFRVPAFMGSKETIVRRCHTQQPHRDLMDVTAMEEQTVVVVGYGIDCKIRAHEIH